MICSKPTQEKKLLNKIHHVGVKYRDTACILSACMWKKQQQTTVILSEQWKLSKCQISAFPIHLMLPLWVHFSLRDFDSALQKSVRVSMETLPSPEGSSRTQKNAFDHITKTISAHLCIMHTPRASQENSLPCSLLLQKQSHRPGLKIFMIRMTEKSSDLQQLLPQQNLELCTETKAVFGKLKRFVANKGLVKGS